LPNEPVNTNLTFTNNSTITGLYSNREIIRASNGSTNNGSLYAFGGTGSGERALGSIASGTTGTVYYGFRFVNTGAISLTNLQVSYTGELWRLTDVTATQTIDFEFGIFDAGAGSITGGGYTGIDSLDYAVTGSGTAQTGGVSSPISTTSISNGAGTAINLAAGQELWIRWADPDNAGTDHGMAIDNLTVTFSAAAAVPEPGTLALLAPGLLAGAVLVARRRKAA